MILVVADTGKHDLGLQSGFAGCGGDPPAKLADPGLGFAGTAVVDRDVMSGFGQVPRHGQAHDAQAQKGNLLGQRREVRFGVDAGHALFLFDEGFFALLADRWQGHDDHQEERDAKPDRRRGKEKLCSVVYAMHAIRCNLNVYNC